MGLDMYLTAEKYFYRDDKKPRIGGIPKGFAAKSVKVGAAYWRKANHIHAWFVRNVQNGVDDCMSYDVAHSQLEELRDICMGVLADRSKCAELLPVQGGFFFGSTEYDVWYFSDLQDTVDQIKAVLHGFDPMVWSLSYRSSW